MKHTRRLIAFLLVVALGAAITGNTFAFGIPVRPGQWQSADARQSAPNGSERFRFDRATYADEDSVRAIVVLDGKPEMESAPGDLKRAAGLRAGLKAEHQKVLDRMKHLKFDLACEFTSVLNGFALDVAYGDLDFIAQLPGVRTVRIATRYDVPEVQKAAPLVMSGGEYTGNLSAAAAGCNGAGQVIAIIDTGLDVSHEAFQDADGLCAGSAVLTRENRGSDTAPGTYISPKIPFAYDYADRDSDVDDRQGHGTHVAGIAAGYACDPEEGSVLFQGAAPAAQLVILKVFGDRSAGTDDSICFKALDEAYRLGVDVVNLSLGSPHGLTEEETDNSDLFAHIYEGLDKAGILVNCSAGNSGSQSDRSTKGYLGVDYNDHGTVGDPASKNGNLSVASMENVRFPHYAIVVEDQPFLYGDATVTALDEVGNWHRAFAGKEIPFAAVSGADGCLGFGTAGELAATDLNGKIAVVRRGVVSFQEKADNAAAAGAVGLIVVNNEPGLFTMTIKPGGIPAVSVAPETGEALAGTGSGMLVTPEEKIVVRNPDAFHMNDFSSWGPTSSLTLDPAITSFGGQVYSAAAGMDHEYVVMSGTSMASPMISGTLANVLSFLDQTGFAGSKPEQARLAETLLLSSATIVPDGDSFYAVRRQGAGLGDASRAIQNYQHAGFIVDPLKELGDDPQKTGVYSFDLTLKNTSDGEVHYGPFKSLVLTDVLANIGSEAQPVYENQKSSMLLCADDAAVTYTVNGSAVRSLDLAAGECAVITVRIQLSDPLKSRLDLFDYGAFVEGFVTFSANGKYENHATFLAYYGDWTQAPIVETADFRDYLDAADRLQRTPGDEVGHSMAELGVRPEQILDVYTMPNLVLTTRSGLLGKVIGIDLAGANLFECMPFRPEYAAFSTSKSDHALANSIQIQPYLLRNASEFRMIFSNAETGVIYKTISLDDYPNIRAIYDPQNQSWTSVVYEIWNGRTDDRRVIPSGTVVHVRIDAVLPYGHNGEKGTMQKNAWNFDITVDDTAPELDRAGIVIDHAAGTMTVTASDAQYLQAIVLKDEEKTDLETISGRRYYDARAFAPQTAGESCTAVFDIQPLLNTGIEQIHVMAMDYATNLTEIPVSLIRKNQPATLTLHQPVSEPERHSLRTGDPFVFPGCADTVEGARFVCWTLAPQDRVPVEEFDQLPQFYPGEQIIVTGNAEYHALYAFGTQKPLETTRYAMDRIRGTYAGSYAIVGMNSVNGSYDPKNPQVLGQNLATVSIAGKEDAAVDPEITAFYTEDPSVRFIVESVGYGLYTIRNAADHTYLAMDGNMRLVSMDSVTDGAVWKIAPHVRTPYAVEITNSVNSDMMLLYHPQTQSIELKAKYTVVGNAPDGSQISARQVMQVWLYGASDEEFIVSGYATTAGSPVTGPDYFRDFTDCEQEWYHEAVNYMVHNGLMVGVDDNHFAPSEGLSRAMAVQVLYRVAGSPQESQESGFSDVPGDAWYSEAVAWAKACGVVAGVGSNCFAPDRSITREQIAVILWSIRSRPKVSCDLSAFCDREQISDYAKDAMKWAVSAGLFSGDGNGRLNPDRTASRAEFAVIMLRYLGGSYVVTGQSDSNRQS